MTISQRRKGGKRTLIVDGVEDPMEDGVIPGAIRGTAKNWRRGIPGDPQHCWLALDAKDSMNADRVVFWKTKALLFINGRWYRYSLRAEATRWIRRFDKGTITAFPAGGILIWLDVPKGKNASGVPHKATGAAGPRATGMKKHVISVIRGRGLPVPATVAVGP